MTRYLAITTCNFDQWQRHGWKMAQTFWRHWPAEISLTVYGEGFGTDQWPNAIDLDEAAPWLAGFKARHRLPEHRGRANGAYNFRWDAIRFSHKIAAIGAAGEDADCDVLIWLDADIVTHARVTADWLAGLFPEPATVAWLDRNGTYPECGFLMFRMSAARKLIGTLVDEYRSGRVFALPQTHDSFVIQQVVLGAGVKVASLSGDARRWHHPFVAGPLGAKMDHFKGESRKAQGRSHRRDIMRPRSEAYWR